MALTMAGLRAWEGAKARLDSAKTDEMELRKKICSEILSIGQSGAVKTTIGGFVVTATGKLNNKIDKEQLIAIQNDLSQAEKDCINWKPAIVAKEYKKLGVKSILHQVITTTEGTPSLAIKPAK